MASCWCWELALSSQGRTAYRLIGRKREYCDAHCQENPERCLQSGRGSEAIRFSEDSVVLTTEVLSQRINSQSFGRFAKFFCAARNDRLNRGLPTQASRSCQPSQARPRR